VVAEGSADELKARLGSETVELYFADVESLEAAAVDGVGEPERLCLRVPSDGSADGLRDLLDRVDGVQRVALHRPSLDDVFLSLTEGV
jgi:ABC-2 type transport system ATP-binding protein